MLKDLNILPRIRDSIGYLYVEHCRIDQEAKAITLVDSSGKTAVPCASLSVLMLGPGTSITHAAIRVLAETGCLVTWGGEAGVRMYAQGLGDTRSSEKTLHQARMWADPVTRQNVVYRMYMMRFNEPLEPGLTLRQIRGKEGLRMRAAYSQASRDYGVLWDGRVHGKGNWSSTDPINRALSAANSCLYGVCHAAIVSAGYSTAIGFIHTGRILSFVYDIADLYKTQISLPTAFRVVGEGIENLEQRVRRTCRDLFFKRRILQRIVPDINYILSLHDTKLPQTQQSSDRNHYSSDMYVY
ncbi:type I-E CRISPR-associated endonuclease Cas1 [SAR202 cluster bacterium AD-804-J14_MRT_500m]|nr:type I-E CRISPR-associated endonuclease Cas1 [SAR202 cluster bacterium AD-804-J14_MRT_500m]